MENLKGYFLKKMFIVVFISFYVIHAFSAYSSDLSEIFMTLRNKLFLYPVPKVFNLTDEKM